jgi:hypothetical protein
VAAELVADCPRGKAKKITFDVRGATIVGREYDWKHWYEAFSVRQG